MNRRRSFLLATCGAIASQACAGKSPKPDAAGGGGAASSSAAKGSSSTGPAAPTFYASVVAENAPGEGPAYLAMTNSTDGGVYITMQIGGAGFLITPPGVTPDRQFSVSADVAGEMKIGYHPPEGGPCVFFKANIQSGPKAWTPGKYYQATVTGPKGMVAINVAETSGEPFVAVRMWNKPGIAGMSSLTVELAGASKPITFDSSFDFPTAYELAAKGPGAKAQIARVRFAVDGKERVANMPLALTGGAGFTVVLDHQPLAGAMASQELK